MATEIDTNDGFSRMVLDGAAEFPPTKPRAYYSADGDSIEFLFSDESYYAERVDCLLTVYYGRESGDIVGSMIKGVRRFVQDVLKDSPGFRIDVEDGRVRLEHLFTAGLWKREAGPTVVKSYKKLRETADEHNVEVEVPELAH